MGHDIPGTNKKVEAAKIRSLKEAKEPLVMEANGPEILPKTRVGCPE
jgi:hypothetical protein